MIRLRLLRIEYGKLSSGSPDRCANAIGVVILARCVSILLERISLCMSMLLMFVFDDAVTKNGFRLDSDEWAHCK